MLELVCDAGVNYNRTGFGWCIIDNKKRTIEVKHHFYSKTVDIAISEFIAIALCYSDASSRYNINGAKIYTDSTIAHNYLMFTGIKITKNKKNKDINDMLGNIKNILRNENVSASYYKNGGKITVLTHKLCHNLASLNTMDAIDNDPNEKKLLDKYNSFITSTKNIIEVLEGQNFKVI